MAASFMPSCAAFLFVILSFSFTQVFLVTCVEFEVGGDRGWVVPRPKNDQVYNQWASNNRFNVGDSIHFKYKKDSVLVVTEEEYEKCHSAHPMFFSNNGDSVFKLDRPGLFYFISGVAGHCERGQKMIIKVLEPANPPQSTSGNSTADSSSKSRATAMAVICPQSLVLFLVFFFALF